MLGKKKAIVTGSTKGIGLAIAKILLKNGYFVVLNYANDLDSATSTLIDLQQVYKEHMDFEIIQQNLEFQNEIDVFYEKCKSIADSYSVLVLQER